MSAWLPEFVCPECNGPTAEDGVDGLRCTRCGRCYVRHHGIWDFLDDGRRTRLDPFVRQYRIVREQEGRRRRSPEYYRALPWVPEGDLFAGEWRIRRESYRHLLRRVFSTAPVARTILDLGAGSGWLCNRLSTLGHHVVALDACADDVDGLGVVRHFAGAIVAVRADFDALPLAHAQFDVVIFNGSLHYAPDPSASLASARRMLASGGTLVVMDSPMFKADRDGTAMLADAGRRLTAENGLHEIVQPGCGYLTFGSLAATAGALRLEGEFVPSRGPLTWRMRRQLARVRLGRQPAAFGMWMAR